MLKHLTIYTIGADIPTPAGLAERMDAMTFQPCGPTQPVSRGFVPPRGEDHGALVETIAGHWLLALKTEQRILPAAVIAEYVEELADTIEEQTGRRPKGKGRRELKEQAIQELLPKAFTRAKVTRIWIDPGARRVAIDTTSDTAADAILTLLVEAAGVPMNLAPLGTNISPSSAMRGWLLDGEAPAPFSIDREAQLRQPDAEKATVSYRHHNLDTDEVRGHVMQGKHPITLAMTYNGRVSFLLTDSLRLKRVALLDVPLEADTASETAADAFDADLTIFAGEVGPLIDSLVEAMGGLLQLPVEAAAAPPDSAPPPDTFDAATDPLYDQAVAVVREHRKPSISLVQRCLRIGYNRAARLLERMERERIVSAQAQDGSRTMLAANEAQPPAGAAAA